jgi:hypothetical protein
VRVARKQVAIPHDLRGWRGGALVGLLVGSVVGIGASFASQWWLLLSIPIGAFVGAVVEAPIQPGRRIPRRTIVTAAVLADVFGAYAVAAAMLAADPYLGNSTLTDGPIADVVGLGTLALAYAGIWMLFLTAPCAVAGAILLRHLRARRGAWEPD